MMNKQKQQDVVAAFRRFQAEREQQPVAEQDAIIRALADEEKAGDSISSELPEDAKEREVLAQYRAFQQQRDPNRDEVIDTVTRYAKERAEQAAVSRESASTSTVSGGSPAASVFGAPSRALSGLAGWWRGFMRDVFGDSAATASGWQMAIPAVALVGVLLWVVQGVNEQSVTGQQVATVVSGESLPAAVAGSAESLLAQLPGESSMAAPTFGFSQSQGVLAAGFELGAAMADLELALAAQDQERVPGMIRKVDRLAQRLNLPALSGQVDLQDDAVKLHQVARHWFAGEPEHWQLYRAGFWMETTRFALALTEQAHDPAPLVQQLDALPAVKAGLGKVLQGHAVQQRQLEKLASTPRESLASYAGRQLFKRQLERTIAVFLNL